MAVGGCCCGKIRIEYVGQPMATVRLHLLFALEYVGRKLILLPDHSRHYVTATTAVS